MGWSLLLSAILAADDGAATVRVGAIEPAVNRTGLDIPLLSGPTTGEKPAPPATPRLLRPNLQPRAVTTPPPASPATPPVESGPILEPPLAGPSTAPKGVRLDPPQLNDVPLLDDFSNLDPLEGDIPPLQGSENPAAPKPRSAPAKPGSLSLEIVPDELSELENAQGTDLESLPDRPKRSDLAEFDENIKGRDNPPLDFGTKRKGPLSRLRPGGNEPRSIVPPPRDRASENNADVDISFRRQLDRAIRAAGAPHIRSQEVLVQDRKVWIRLKADRFWNKRTLRKSVESLPILAGYDVRLDVE